MLKDLFQIFTKRKPITETTIEQPKEPEQKAEISAKNYKVAGVTHYQDNILSLAIENPDYYLNKKEIINSGLENTKIYQYDFCPNQTELIPEPDNPHDPNAIKVIVDKKHVGYVKAGSCKHILKLIKEEKIERIDCEIYGGKYKKLYYDEYEKISEMEQESTEYGIKISIFER